MADQIRTTERLTLVPCHPAQHVTLLTAPEQFAEHAGFPLHAALSGMYTTGDISPEWLASLEGAAGPDPWQFGFFLVETSTGIAIGTAGFTGPPDGDGVAEIAYGLVSDREGQGLATEAAAALIDFAFEDARVTRLMAHTRPETNASTRVLTKNGFTFVGEETVPYDGLVWRWERGR